MTVSNSTNPVTLSGHSRLRVHQMYEIAEMFGFETRNKYEILDEQGVRLAFAAEQQKGFWNLIVRQYLGHWRKFDVLFFTPDRKPFLVCHHPFRWIFERIEIRDTNGRFLGAIQKRFSLFTKRFDVENDRGMAIMEVASPIWKIWTFSFMSRGKKIAGVNKKWSGFLAEAFTDKDNFEVLFEDSSLSEDERMLVMVSAVFVDLLYFENKAE